jgi:hypothetical protein
VDLVFELQRGPILRRMAAMGKTTSTHRRRNRPPKFEAAAYVRRPPEHQRDSIEKQREEIRQSVKGGGVNISRIYEER